MERFLDYFVPERYQMTLEVDKEAKTLKGVVKISGAAKQEKIKFHAVGLSVDQVRVNGKKTAFQQENGVLTLVEVPRSDLEVEVGYHGSLNENMEGAYLSTYEYQGATEVIVATQFESHYAREAFPCIDEPAAKAVFELSITVPECSAEDTILANTPVKKVIKGSKSGVEASDGEDGDVETGDDRGGKTKKAQSESDDRVKTCGGKTVIFAPTPRMSAYLLAFVIGKLQGRSVTNRDGVKITTYAALNQEPAAVDLANEVAAKSLEFYGEQFGVPYPLEKLDQVALPDFEAGAMENWGLVTYRESMLLAPKTATQATKKSVALTVAHELAHQWFGDLVTMAWWDDLWLNESFASVMEYYAVDALYPEFRIWDNFYTEDVLVALKRDALEGVQAVHQEVESPEEIATLFDGAIVYAKGARLILMLIRLMGWKQFCRGVHKYCRAFAYRNAKGDDFWQQLQPFCDFQVGELMHAFIDRPGYPVLTAQRSREEGSEELAVQRSKGERAPEGRGAAEFATYTQQRFLLEGVGAASDWPIPEVREDLSGHYILNLTDEQFAERLERFDELGDEEKLRLLIDRNLIAKTALAPSVSLLPLLEKFKTASQAVVWDVVLTIVGELKIFFEFQTPEEKNFKRFVGELGRAKLAEIGVVPAGLKDDGAKSKGGGAKSMGGNTESEDDNTTRLRSDLLALALYAEDRSVAERLAALYQEDLGQLEPELRDSILYAKIYLEPGVYDYYLEQYQKTAEPEIKDDLLSAMTASKDTKTATRVLALLTQPEIVKLQDQLFLFAGLYRNPVTRERAWQWLKTHWTEVAEANGDKSIESYPRFLAAAAKTEAELAAFREFFLPKRHEPALTRAIEVGEREIVARLKLIETDRAAVYEFLRTRQQ